MNKKISDLVSVGGRIKKDCRNVLHFFISQGQDHKVVTKISLYYLEKPE